ASARHRPPAREGRLSTRSGGHVLRDGEGARGRARRARPWTARDPELRAYDRARARDGQLVPHLPRARRRRRYEGRGEDRRGDGPLQRAPRRTAGRDADRLRPAGLGAQRVAGPRARCHTDRQEGAARSRVVGAAAADRLRRGRTHGASGACPARHSEGARMTKLLVVHGPNLNLLGKREPHIYGTRSLADLNDMVKDKARELKTEVAVFQSNIEGELIDFLQKE